MPDYTAYVYTVSTFHESFIHKPVTFTGRFHESILLAAFLMSAICSSLDTGCAAHSWWPDTNTIFDLCADMEISSLVLICWSRSESLPKTLSLPGSVMTSTKSTLYSDFIQSLIGPWTLPSMQFIDAAKVPNYCTPANMSTTRFARISIFTLGSAETSKSTCDTGNGKLIRTALFLLAAR